MKCLLIILLLAIPAGATAQLTPHDQRWERTTETDKTIGRVLLHDGSIINGRIVEAEGKVSITTFDGNLFVYNKDQVLRVEYGKAYQPKSGALAVVLSLIIPGWGNYYVGDNVGGTVFFVIGVAGAATMFYGMSKSDSPFSNGETLTAVGAATYWAASAVSAATAYQGSKPPTISNAKVSLLSFQF